MIWNLQNFDSTHFIEHYWQKKPCLIRQAFPHLKSPISAEELAGMACEAGVHSRLIQEKPDWQLRYGPFQEQDFLTLPDSHYTLLVSECDQWLPDFHDLLSAFRFLPTWRLDDIMLSYAAPAGSVGPHTDEYDVFLLQIQGQRQWQYSNEPMGHAAIMPNLDLAILQSFEADQQAILAPGDMLYLPPGIAHQGIAVDRCMTCSIGFRAPTATEILESFTLEVDQQALGAQRYKDPMLQSNRHCAEITDTEINHLRDLALSLLKQPTDSWVNAAGKLLSDTTVTPLSDVENYSEFNQLKNLIWTTHPGTRMLYHRSQSVISFFYNAQLVKFPFSENTLAVIQELCTGTHFSIDFFTRCQEPALKQLLVDMAAHSAIMPLEQSTANQSSATACTALCTHRQDRAPSTP